MDPAKGHSFSFFPHCERSLIRTLCPLDAQTSVTEEAGFNINGVCAFNWDGQRSRLSNLLRSTLQNWSSQVTVPCWRPWETVTSTAAHYDFSSTQIRKMPLSSPSRRATVLQFCGRIWWVYSVEVGSRVHPEFWAIRNHTIQPDFFSAKIGWLVSPRDLPVSASPVLEL